MSPTTWEEATCDVAVALPSWREGAELTLDEVLQDIDETLDEMRSGAHGVPESSFRYLAWLGAVGYVHEKWGLHHDQGKSLHVEGRFPELCDDAVRSVLVLLPKKQHDYGPDNILWGGVQGVVVRAHDKLARIKNLRKRAANGDIDAPYHEPLADSYFDLIGYGIVGAMLVKGTFQLPLEADLAIDTDEIADGDSVLVGIVRAVVRDEIAKREKAKLHG